MSAPPRDPLRCLQIAARLAAEHASPGNAAGRVVVFDRQGNKVLDVTVPLSLPVVCDEPPEPQAATSGAAGWSFDRGPAFDGRPVAVAASRVKLLKALVEADGPLPAKELIGPVFDRHTSETNVRFHVGELRKELRAAFPDFEGDTVEGTGEGYVLALR